MRDEGIRYDIIIVNADRLQKPYEIWKRISILKPERVVLHCDGKESEICNRQLMMKNGYKIINQEVEKHGKVSRKFYVGSRNKFHSD